MELKEIHSIFCSLVNNMALKDTKQITVNVDNFVRAETDMQFAKSAKMAGGVNRWFHNYQPTPLDKQPIIRMNRDTLYSIAVVDISQGATFTMPDSGDRYMVAQVINQDHYTNQFYNDAGSYPLNMDEFHTPYVYFLCRTLIDESDPKDIEQANRLQEKMSLKAVSSKPFVHPEYDMASYKKTYELLLQLSQGISEVSQLFGKKEDVNPVRHLLGSAFGWGGLPESEASYEAVNPNLPVGGYQITVKEVPVDAFWSVTVYNKEGFLEKNEFNAYNVNSLKGTPNEDKSITINFGDCKDGRQNCIPIMEGWNYIVRLYKPQKPILEGKYRFPSPKPVKS